MNRQEVVVEGYDHKAEYGKRIGQQLLKLKDAVICIITFSCVVFGGGLLFVISLLIAVAGMLARIAGKVKH